MFYISSPILSVQVSPKSEATVVQCQSHYRSALTGKYLEYILVIGNTDLESQLSKINTPLFSLADLYLKSYTPFPFLELFKFHFKIMDINFLKNFF